MMRMRRNRSFPQIYSWTTGTPLSRPSIDTYSRESAWAESTPHYNSSWRIGLNKTAIKL